MQPVTLNQTGQFAIIASNEALVDVLRIRNYHDEISGVGQLIKEFSWSKDKNTWSYWTTLTQDALIALSDNGFLPATGFYIRFRYALASVGTMVISDVGIDIEYNAQDPNKGYVPYGYKIGSMNCVECGSMRGAILNQCTSTFNPYLVNPAIDLYKDICYSVQNMFGLDVMYMRAVPKENAGDTIFKEWTLYGVDEAVCTKVMVPDNKIPFEINYDPYGLGYIDEFEVHIVKQNFEELFGPDAAPQQNDIIYLPIANALYNVSSSTPNWDFMMQHSWWKVNLVKYQPKSNTYAKEAINKMLDDITKDSFEAFGAEIKKDTEDIVKPQQYDRLVGTNLKDPIRKYIDQKLKIFNQSIKNHATVISEYSYDGSSIFKTNASTVAVQYAVKSNFKSTDNFSFSCWFKDTSIKYNIPEDPVKIVSVIGNVARIFIQASRNYIPGTYLQLARQGRLNVYGKVTNVIDHQNYEVTIPQEVIDYVTGLSSAWSTAPGWYCKQCFEKIYIDGLGAIGSPVAYKGWKISSFADRYIIVNINNVESFFILPETLSNIWYAMFFNYAAAFGQMNMTLWKLKDTRLNTTDLDVVFTKTIDGITSEDKNNDLEYNLMASNMFLTNIRIFDEIVEYEKQSTVLNQNIIKDSSHLIIADNANPLLNLPYIANAK